MGAPLQWRDHFDDRTHDARLESRAPSTRRALLATAFLLLPLPAAAQLRAPTRWYAVQGDDKAFTVELPGIPDHRVLSDVSARGTAFALHSYSLDAGGVSYAVQAALYPSDVDVSEPRSILQVALDDRAKRLEGGRWSATHWQTIDGSPAVESLGALGGGRGLRQVMVLKQRRYVALAFLGPADSIRSPDADRFFKSLRLKQ